MPLYHSKVDGNNMSGYTMILEVYLFRESFLNLKLVAY